MKKLSTFLFTLLLVSVINSSCKKDSTTTTTPTPTPIVPVAPGAPMPVFPSSVSGGLIALKTISKIITFPGFPAEILYIGTAVAVFPGTVSGTYVDAGTVKVDTVTLTKQTNNSYLFTPGLTSPTGIDFSTGVPSWQVSGSSAIPAFTASANAFPSDVDITSATTVNTANAYTLITTAVTSADSLVFAIHGPTKSLIVTKVASFSSNTFTAADLATVGKGAGFIQISALKYKSSINGGKTYWLINQNVSTVAATFQ